ncbi:unnamed protein product [Lampetra planeri]
MTDERVTWPPVAGLDEQMELELKKTFAADRAAQGWRWWRWRCRARLAARVELLAGWRSSWKVSAPGRLRAVEGGCRGRGAERRAGVASLAGDRCRLHVAGAVGGTVGGGGQATDSIRGRGDLPTTTTTTTNNSSSSSSSS